MIKQNQLPKSIKLLVQHYGAWIVGGSANPDALISTVRDIDVVVPFSRWNEASSLIPTDAKINEYGGWKFKQRGLIIDVWPEDLSVLMLNHKLKYIWQPRFNILYEKV